VEIKCQLDATDVFFIADLIACSTCFGHYYAHYQELKSIIQWLLRVVFCAVVFKLLVCRAVCCVSGLRDAATLHQTSNFKTKAPNTPGSNHLYNILDLLMMGIMVPETCSASNKVCNKKKPSVATSWHFISTY